MSCWPGKVIQNQSSVSDSKKWGKLLDKPEFLHTFKMKDPGGETSYPSSGWGRRIMNLRSTWPVSWVHDQPGNLVKPCLKTNKIEPQTQTLPYTYILPLKAWPKCCSAPSALETPRSHCFWKHSVARMQWWPSSTDLVLKPLSFPSASSLYL